MKLLLVMLLCMVLSFPMLAIAQDQPTTANEPAAATTPAAGAMPGMMGPAMGGGMGPRGGMGGGMQMKASAQEMIGYLKLCDEVKNNPADMEKINKWTAASADQATTQAMAGMAGMAAARVAAMKDTGAMLVDTLTMMKGCTGLKEDKAKTDSIDQMIAKATAISQGKAPAPEGVPEEAKETPADITDPQAVRRQMMMQSMAVQKLIPDTAKMMKDIPTIAQNPEASKGLDAIVARGEQMQEGMKRMMQNRQQQMNAPAGATPAPGAVTPAAVTPAPDVAAPAAGGMQ